LKIVFIRHGEPDKSYVDEKGFIGQGRDLAPLSHLGITQANEVSHHPLLDDGQLIISSPYTRALQTAAIISKNTGIEINVEIDLHEFIPDKTFMVKGEEENISFHKDFMRHQGEYPEGETRKWETISEIIKRSKPVLDKYMSMEYTKIIVVAHGGVIRRYTGERFIDYCEASEIEYTDKFACYQWV
jgi:broad specificity phosphatase PhoE